MSKRFTIPTDQLRIDGGTQARVAIHEATVAEYADAIGSGAEFPPVIVFFDGTDYWLADGFHRYHGHRRAGAPVIAAEIRNGTQREAVLHSLGSNSTHGLPRNNADKRKAVETLLADPEWREWSDRKIAEACAVGHPFVAAVRNPQVAGRQQEARDRSAAKRVESDSTPRAGATSAVTPAATKAASDLADFERKVESFPPAAPGEPPADPDDGAPSPEELAALERAEEEERAALQRLLDADDKMKLLHDENVRLRAELRMVKSRCDGLMAEKNEAVRAAKTWQRRAEKAEKAGAAA